jgi:glutaryl-CoA dehydrogenase
VGAFVVERGAPGFETRVITGKIAKRASWQADVTLDGVRVPAGNRLAGAESFDVGRQITGLSAFS